ncbi:MAG TPA: chemotaxis protein CheW [Polyangiaceae bacterium]|jgi:purine-binding chemotaxis protein CheW
MGPDREGVRLTAQELASERMLLCRVGTRLCGIAVRHVAETMRPLPLEPVAGMPAFVLGLALIRGTPTPVIDLAFLLLGPSERQTATRFVTVKAGQRIAALAVSHVIGIRDIPTRTLGALPPLAQEVKADFIETIGSLDDDMLMMLNGARIVPSSVWTVLSTSEVPP